MGSEAQTMSDHSLSPTVHDLITELKECFTSIDFKTVAKILTNREQNLLNKTHFLENENKNLNAMLKEQDLKIESLEKENDGLKNEVFQKDEILKEKDVKIENLERENDGLKDEVKKKESEIGVYETENKKMHGLLKEKDLKIESLEKENDGLKNEVKKMKNDLGVRVLNLESLCKELMDSEVKKGEKVVAESSRLPPPPGFEEIPDPKLKKEKESKFLEIIEIDDDDDDDDDDDHGDHDLMKMSSSKRRRVSSDDDDDDDDHGDHDLMKVSSSKRRHVSSDDDDDDDDKCISVLKRKKVSKKVTKDHKNAKYKVKIATKTQPKSYLKSPFCDTSGSDSDD